MIWKPQNITITAASLIQNWTPKYPSTVRNSDTLHIYPKSSSVFETGNNFLIYALQEELPWCIICNEDATVMCLDCDNDLYCKSCFSQGHDEWQLQHHRNVPFTPKKWNCNSKAVLSVWALCIPHVCYYICIWLIFE
jgi:hypothetical protein